MKTKIEKAIYHATPGSGKQFLTMEIINYIKKNPNVKILIIDPDKEYAEIAKELGAQCLDGAKVITDGSRSGMSRAILDFQRENQELRQVTDPKQELEGCYFGKSKSGAISGMNFSVQRNKSNEFVIGKSGSGKGYHPWDNLNKCSKCGGFPWMEIDEDYDSKNYGLCKIKCLQCDSETPIASINVAKSLWNE